MRIAIFYPYLEARGGAEKHASKVAQHLSERNEILVYSVWKEEIGVPEWWEGLNIRRAWHPIRTPLLRRTINELTFLIRNPTIEEDSDLIIGFGPHGVTMAGYQDRIPTIGYFFHPWYTLYPRPIDRDPSPISNLIFKKPPLSTFLKVLDRRKVNRVKELAANSPIIAKMIRQIYRREAHIMMPGVDIVPLVEKNPCRDYIFIPTRVVYHKNLHTAVKALYILRKRFSRDIDLIISGSINDPIYWSYIQEMIARLELGKYVRHIGFVPDEELWSLYRNAVCHWFISYMEDFGLTALESLSQETPVIASNDGGARYTMIDGETGYLVDPNDAHSFAEKTAYLLDNPDVREEMGKKGRRHVLRNFTWEKHFREWDRLIERVT